MIKDIEPWDDEYSTGYFDENGKIVIHPSDAIYITHESRVDYGLIHRKKKIVSEIVDNHDIIVEFCRDNNKKEEEVDQKNDNLSRIDIMNDILHAFCIGIAEITKTNDSNESPKKNQLQSIILVPTKENVEHIRRLFFTLQKNLSIKTITEIDDILYYNIADDPHIIISTTAFMYRVLSNQYVNMDHIRFILLMDNENIMKKMQEMVYYIPSTVKYGIITNCPDVEIPSIIFQEKKNHVRIKVS